MLRRTFKTLDLCQNSVTQRETSKIVSITAFSVAIRAIVELGMVYQPFQIGDLLRAAHFQTLPSLENFNEISCLE